MKPVLFAVCCVVFVPVACWALTDAELDRIGKKVWQNECGGTRDGLTSWNAGENFASLGIGHFIWYPRGVDGPFDESFPRLAKYLKAQGVKVADWMEGDCPWDSKGEFQKDFRSARMNELRDMLAGTIRIQSRFLAERMEGALPKILKAAPGDQRETVERNFKQLTESGSGTFALIDYVNFKGEGTKPEERYKGEGWGLLQVLAGMGTGSVKDAPKRFAASAERVLTRRVELSPPARNEKRWLPGWTNRVRAYAG